MALRFPSVAGLLLLGVGALAAKQSPIDIVEDNTETTSLPDLVFNNYGSSQSHYAIENTGHSAQITLTNRFVPTVTGGPFGRKVYKLQQVHFHWGRTAGVGSEHLLNGKPFSMEVHLVHYNSKYRNFEEAAEMDDGLAVVGHFIEGAQSSWSFNNDFQRVVDGVRRVTSSKAKVSSRNDLLKWVLPFLKPRGYFTYEGSLTTEPYSENVKWVMFKDPVLINANQVEAFREMHGSEHDLTENFREIQPLDGRVVEFVSESSQVHNARTNVPTIPAERSRPIVLVAEPQRWERRRPHPHAPRLSPRVTNNYIGF